MCLYRAELFRDDKMQDLMNILPLRQPTILPEKPIDAVPSLVPEVPVPLEPLLVVVHEIVEAGEELWMCVTQQHQAEGGDGGVQRTGGIGVGDFRQDLYDTHT